MGIGTNQREILQHFKLEGGIADVTNHGSGHINHTFLVTTDGEKRYILQRINTDIFHDTDGLMENIVNVTSYLRERIIQAGGNPERETMTVIPTKDGKYY